MTREEGRHFDFENFDFVGHTFDIKYSQPHNIVFNTGNPALDYKLAEREHHRQKYIAKYKASKQSKRMR